MAGLSRQSTPVNDPSTDGASRQILPSPTGTTDVLMSEIEDFGNQSAASNNLDLERLIC